jgi:hypothetical protein
MHFAKSGSAQPVADRLSVSTSGAAAEMLHVVTFHFLSLGHFW